MPFIADLHIHSRFSRATSKGLTLPALHAGAQRKGIDLLGTGDFTHPAWRAELTDQLEPAEPGLFKLKNDLIAEAERDVPFSCKREVRFILQVEISTIYKALGKTRKVHHIILSPSLEGAEQLSSALDDIGNISSDGRPILGLDSRDLLEIVLERCPGGCLIPAHIWTPWFSVLGSKGGFDAVEECYRDLTQHIFAVETGLSSDPPMNWRVEALDRFALVSNSDAHSTSKLARECNLFDTELSFEGVMDALRSRDPQRFLGTVEFFPEEGKYHLDGHRKCSARLQPSETRELGSRCPSCGRPVTVGVMHRVEDLADRPIGSRPEGAPSFVRLVGLAETVGHVLECGPKTKKVDAVTDRLLSALGSELFVLREAGQHEIEQIAGDLVAEAISRVRQGKVTWKAGYDGEFGTFEILNSSEREAISGQMSFFEQKAPRPEPSHSKPSTTTSPAKPRGDEQQPDHPLDDKPPKPDTSLPSYLVGLSDEQLQAVVTEADSPLLVIAGPGTGKTRTLTARIAHQIHLGEHPPSDVLALTFTNRAAEEMTERLNTLLGPSGASTPPVMTFHSFGLSLLRTAGLDRPRIVDDSERTKIVARAIEFGGGKVSRKLTKFVARAISLYKSGGPLQEIEDQNVPKLETILIHYEAEMRGEGAFDFDDLVLKATEAIERSSHSLPSLPAAVFVDEYQDLNTSQVRLLRTLMNASGETMKLFAIGDPDQAIYGFRGADPEGILKFENDWPSARILSLGRSYRSSDTILEAAAQVISKAPGLNRPRLWSGLQGEPHLIVLSSKTSETETDRIALLIETLLGGTSLLSFDSGLLDGQERMLTRNLSFSDVAVLYRLQAQGEPIAKALGRLGLPVQMSQKKSTGDDGAITSVLDGLRYATGRLSTEERCPVAPVTLPDNIGTLGAQEAVEQVARAILGVEATSDTIRPLWRRACAIDKAWESKVHKKVSFVKPGRATDDLLDWYALHSEVDHTDPRAERISLMTLHAAKGLEWKVVVIAGCEDGLIPHHRPGGEETFDIDEERRLFFVGMTRAEQLLVLSHAEERSLYGQRRQSATSPFLLEIEKRYLKEDSGKNHLGTTRRQKHQMTLF